MIFKRLTALIVKDGAAFSSPLKSQESRFLIPNKTHRKADSLVIAVPVQVTVTVGQVAVPSAIRIVLSGTPKDCIETLTVERAIEVTVTLREGVKVTAVV